MNHKKFLYIYIVLFISFFSFNSYTAYSADANDNNKLDIGGMIMHHILDDINMKLHMVL